MADTSKVVAKHNHSQLRKAAFFAILHALIPLAALALYAYLGQREAAITTAKRDASYLLEVSAQTYKNNIQAAKSILTVLAAVPEITSGSKAECDAFTAKLLKQFPNYYLNFGVVDKNGFIYCSGIPITQNVDARQRSWYLETLKNNDFSIGTYQIGTITKKQSVNFGYPIRNNGDINGVVFAAIDLSWIKTATDNFSLAPGSTITVIDREGTVLARYSEKDGFIGTNQQNSPLISKVLASKTSGSLFEKDLDGVERYYSYEKIIESSPDGDFYIIIGTPQSILTASANQAFIKNLIIMIAIFSLSIGIAFLDWKLFIEKRPISS